ncbi:hypothetical protein EV426DRAFT_292664 [Tirmania nivea]|nr:hypothetical protein EV426DRAFT_292664 [Tirmania nivea]
MVDESTGTPVGVSTIRFIPLVLCLSLLISYILGTTRRVQSEFNANIPRHLPGTWEGCSSYTTSESNSDRDASLSPLKVKCIRPDGLFKE